jgi:glutaredoxin
MFYIYGKPNCTYCTQAVSLLTNLNIAFQYIDVVETNNVDWLQKQGFRTVPQIWYEATDSESHVGGFDELKSFIIDKMDDLI